MKKSLQASCAQDQLCLPSAPDPASAAKVKDKSFMVLVRPSEHKHWSQMDETYTTDLEGGRMTHVQREKKKAFSR